MDFIREIQFADLFAQKIDRGLESEVIEGRCSEGNRFLNPGRVGLGGFCFVFGGHGRVSGK